jgi:hypothetical protein
MAFFIRYAIMAVFTGIFILGVVFSIQLEPPEEQEPWFSNSHMFTKLDNWNKDNFGVSSDDLVRRRRFGWGEGWANADATHSVTPTLT